MKRSHVICAIAACFLPFPGVAGQSSTALVEEVAAICAEAEASPAERMDREGWHVPDDTQMNAALDLVTEARLSALVATGDIRREEIDGFRERVWQTLAASLDTPGRMRIAIGGAGEIGFFENLSGGPMTILQCLIVLPNPSAADATALIDRFSILPERSGPGFRLWTAQTSVPLQTQNQVFTRSLLLTNKPNGTAMAVLGAGLTTSPK